MTKELSSRDREMGRVRFESILLIFYTLLVFITTAVISAPSWWASRGVTTADPPDHYAVANQGQIKHIATEAYHEFEAHLPGGAGSVLASMVSSWTTPTGNSDDYAGVNIGQLKNVAQPFYDRLIAEGYTTQYHWTSTTTDDDDYALANLGQVKYLFSFDLTFDSESDGLPDWWEQLIIDANAIDSIDNINQVSPGDDYDGDHWTNLEEYQNGTDPTVTQAASLPFTETFESYTAGSALHEQNGWITTGDGTATVTSVQAAEGVQGLELSVISPQSSVTVAHTFNATGQIDLWIDLQLIPVLSAATAPPPTLTATTAAGYYATDDGLLHIYNGTTSQWNSIDPATHSLPALDTISFRRITINLDYTTQTFDFYLDEVQVANDYGFANPTLTELKRLTFESSESTTYIDALAVTTINPLIPPAAPDGLTAYEQQSGDVQLSWNDNSNNEGSFLLEMSEDGGTTWTPIALTPSDVTAFTLAAVSVTDPATALFRISASNGAGSTSGSQDNVSTSPEPDEDWDNDGLSNEEELECGTDPDDEDTDNDGLFDNEDAWPVDESLRFLKIPETNYAQVDLSTLFDLQNYRVIGLDDEGNLLLEHRHNETLFQFHEVATGTTHTIDLDGPGAPSELQEFRRENNAPDWSASLRLSYSNGHVVINLFGYSVNHRHITGSVHWRSDTQQMRAFVGGFRSTSIYGYSTNLQWGGSATFVESSGIVHLVEGIDNGTGLGSAYSVISGTGSARWIPGSPPSDIDWFFWGWDFDQTPISDGVVPGYESVGYVLEVDPSDTYLVGRQQTGPLPNSGVSSGPEDPYVATLNQPNNRQMLSFEATNVVLDYFNEPVASGDDQYAPQSDWTARSYQVRKPGNPTPQSASGVQRLSPRGEFLAENGTVLIRNGKRLQVMDLLPAGSPQVTASHLNANGLALGTPTSSPNNPSFLLLPIEIDSRDRAVKGSFEIPEGWDQVGLSFRNKDTGQDLGSYENLEPGATTDVHIYDSADDFFSDSEMQQNANGTLPDNVLNQEVVFARNADNPRKLEFSTVFDELGEIEVVLTFGSNQTEAIITHTLEEDAEMSDFITRMDQRVSSLEVPGGEEILIDEDGDGIPDGGSASDILQAFQPGTLTTSGAPVGEYHEDDPANLTLLINKDDDNGDSQNDNSDTLVDATDNDIVKLLLKRPVNQPADSGTLTLSVIGGTGNVRVFTPDGQNQLTNYSVDLANPTGDLAGLANGSLPVYVEGLAQANDVTFIWSYTDAGGTPQVSDEVHLNVVDPSLITMMNMFAPVNGGLQYAYGNNRSIRTRSYAANGAAIWNEMALAPVGEALPIENRGMLARVFWKVPQVRQQIAFTKGFVDGFWVALKGEAETVTGVWTFFTDDPFGRAAGMWGAVNEAVDELSEIPADQIPTLLANIAKNITDDLYTQAEAALPWQPLEANLSPDVLYYMYGFATGTVAEGVVVSLLGVGVVTKTATVIKGVIATAKTGRYALTALSQTRKSAAKVTHMMLRMARNEGDSVRIGSIGKYLEKTDAPSGKKMAEVIDEAFRDKPNISKRYYEKLKGHWPDVTDEARLATRYQKAQHSLAKTVDLLGDDLTDNGLEGFGLTQKYLFKDGVDDLDRADDLIKAFDDLDTPTKRQAFNETMEQAKTTLDAGNLPDSGLRVSSKISDVYPDMYHYIDEDQFRFFDVQGIGQYQKRSFPGGSYISPDRFDDSIVAKTKLQIPDKPGVANVDRTRYRCKLKVKPIENDLDFPIANDLENNVKFNNLEPRTKDNPQYGVGGGKQFTTTREMEITEIWDVKEGRQLTDSEIVNLINQFN